MSISNTGSNNPSGFRGPSADEHSTTFKIKPIKEQTRILARQLGNIGVADIRMSDAPLHNRAEGWFAIPRWSMVAPSYGEAVNKIIGLIAHERRLSNQIHGGLDSIEICQSERTAESIERITDTQSNSEILVIAAQTGLLYRGSSSADVSKQLEPDEFGLGTFAIASIILTHPERLATRTDLWILCVGDRCRRASAPFKELVPAFLFDERRVIVGVNDTNMTGMSYGAASAFF